MESPTKKEFEDLCKTVKDVADLVKAGKDGAKEQVAAIVKQALAAHPGRTHQPIEYPNGKAFDRTERGIVAKMPVELQDRIDGLYVASKLLGVSPRQLKSFDKFRQDAAEFTKALDSTTAGGVDEWVPTDFTPQLEKLIRLDQRVAALFREIPMTSNPYTLPIQVGAVVTSKQAEQTADTGQTKIKVGDSNALSGQTVLSAFNHAARVLFSKEASEDSIIAVLPFLMEEYAVAFREGRDDGILNGDTAGTHEDSDVTDAQDRRKLWLGLRATANDQSYKTDLSTFTLSSLRGVRSAMGKFAVNPRDLVYIVSPVGYYKMLGLAEVTTVDKYGPAATILSGELAKLDGIPIVVSEQVREDLNASGVEDGVTTTKTVLYLANRRGHVWGNRRGFATQVLRELYAESGQDALIATERKAFRDLHPIADNQTVRIGFNIA